MFNLEIILTPMKEDNITEVSLKQIQLTQAQQVVFEKFKSFLKKDDVLYPHLIKGVKVSFQIKAIPDKPLDKAIRLKLDV